jgi:hypothetical protein
MATTAKKTAAKAAPAPAPAPVESEQDTIAAGDKIVFTGYAAEVEEADRILTEGTLHTVVGFTDPDEAQGDPGGDVIVAIDNPDFDPSKKESQSNARTLQVVVFDDEFRLASEDEIAAAEAETAAAAAPAPAPAPAKGKQKVKAEAAAAPAPAATKGKQKAVAPAKPPAPEKVEADPDALPDLDVEDESVLALVNGEENIVTVAQSLEQEAAVNEYRLGGVLYHIRKGGAYKELDPDGRYNDKGGFQLFLTEFFTALSYRKAMYLVQIYISFTKALGTGAAEAVGRIGWTKASKIAESLEKEGTNANDLVELAANNTVEGLTEALKDTVAVGGGTPAARVERTRLNLKFLQDQGATVLAILDAVKESQTFGTYEEAFAYVCTEFAAQNGVATPKAEVAEAPAKASKAPAVKATAKPAPAAPAAKRPAVRKATA